MAEQNQKPQLPEGTWAVTKEDKEKIVAFGRSLNKFVIEYARANSGNGAFHAKIIAGGFQYFMDLQKQKATLIGDDILIAQDSFDRYGLGEFITEPFTEEPEVEAPESVPETVPEAPAMPEAPASDPDVDAASVAPQNQPVQVNPNEERPQGQA